MSQPPTTTTPPPQPPPYHLQPPPPYYNIPSTSTTVNILRDHRKGNWTIQETLTLITAKKIDDERRSAVKPSSKPVELKWKWVENYCWAHGCFRSQNQCNDKWDNLLRDYKKIREYQIRSSKSNGSDEPDQNYFSMERHQRKEKNLPSNMTQEVYQALNFEHVVQRRYPKAATSSRPLSITPPPIIVASLPPPPPPPAPADVSEQLSESSGREESKQDDVVVESDDKRNKLRKIGSSIVDGASALAQTLNLSEEKKQKRHEEIMKMENRRLEIEEARNEVNQNGISNLVGAMTNLSGAIQSLVTSTTYYNQT